MANLLYKPIGLILGSLAGVLASKIFDSVWARISDDDPADPQEKEADWSEIALSAALSGAIFATVRALTQRAGAVGFEKQTGVWPGSESGNA